jgi:hypothetical protein
MAVVVLAQSRPSSYYGRSHRCSAARLLGLPYGSVFGSGPDIHCGG